MKGGACLSVAEAITLMLAFGSFVLSLVNTFVTLVKAIQDNQKDRH
ncbi:putative holin-like toxin [Lacticaseibacillus paracasei]